MDEKIICDVEQKIVKLFSKKDHGVYKRLLEYIKKDDADLFLSLSKVSMLIFGRPDFDALTYRHIPRVDIDAPIVDGMFPLHLAVLTSSGSLVAKLIEVYGAKLDVKCCGDPHSPFYALTPLEMTLNLMTNLIPWTTQMSVNHLLRMFHTNVKARLLMVNTSLLLRFTPSIRHVISNYSLQGKVVEVAALLKVASSFRINFSTMYIPTANIPPELHFGVPMMLRLLVASRSASLIKEGIRISASLNPEEHDNCRRKIKEMDSIRTLLEAAHRGDLNDFDVKNQLTAELTDGSSKASQDEFKVNTVAPQYLNNSLFYTKPSKFQPSGAFNSLLPFGYKDSLESYDGLDIRNCNALAETIFRVLDGRKVDEFSLVDTSRFQFTLTYYLQNKSKEAETLTALETNQLMEKKGSTLRLSLPHNRTTDLKVAVSNPLIKAYEQLAVNKISSSVFSAIKKGKT